MDLIGKTLRYKNSSTNEIKKVENVVNGRVIFTDKGSADLQVVYEKFEVVPEQGTMNDYITPPSTPSLEYSNLGDTFMQQLQNIANQPPALSNEVVSPMDGLSEEARKMFNQPTVNHTPVFDNFNLSNNVKRFDVNGNIIDDSIPVSKPLQQNNSLFPKMKKSNRVKLVLTLDEMIPKIEEIKAISGLFDVSIIDELAKEIAHKYINDFPLFEGMIIAELERLINKKKPTKPKPKLRK